MRVVSHKKLKDFYETKGCEDSRVALERWYDIAEKAEWRNLSDKRIFYRLIMWAINTMFLISEGTTIGW